VLRSDRRDALSQFLREREIQSLVHYPVIIPEQPAMLASRADPRAATNVPYTRGSLPVAERCAREFLSLPIHPELSLAEVDTVCAAVRAFFESA
jgi:dTDP-4-amino-4,6-dideoxygalactose transaminase